MLENTIKWLFDNMWDGVILWFMAVYHIVNGNQMFIIDFKDNLFSEIHRVSSLPKATSEDFDTSIESILKEDMDNLIDAVIIINKHYDSQGYGRWSYV